MCDTNLNEKENNIGRRGIQEGSKNEFFFYFSVFYTNTNSANIKYVVKYRDTTVRVSFILLHNRRCVENHCHVMQRQSK